VKKKKLTVASWAALVVGITRDPPASSACRERKFFIDNLLVRIHFIIVMIRWTGLAPWELTVPATRRN